jgi:hypothetical protein
VPAEGTGAERYITQPAVWPGTSLLGEQVKLVAEYVAVDVTVSDTVSVVDPSVALSCADCAGVELVVVTRM